MHDEWLDRLSDYLDGELDVAAQAALEEHLVECDVCRVTLGELRAVVAAARSVENPPPERDLWPAIAAAIDARAAGGVVPLRPARSRRRISFTVPQLAAAALLLMAGSGAAVWFLSGAAGARTGAPVSGTIVHAAAAEPSGAARLVATIPPDPEFEATVAQLEQTLAQRGAQLDPATVEVLERSMESIDRAITDARAALLSDPGNPYLRRQLESTMRRKLDLLRRASGIQRAGA
jgi:anti-sigma factor RsiW